MHIEFQGDYSKWVTIDEFWGLIGDVDVSELEEKCGKDSVKEKEKVVTDHLVEMIDLFE